MTFWKRKRKLIENPSASGSNRESAFSNDDDDGDVDPDVDWLTATKRTKSGALEDATAKSKRLKEEGTLLAEQERYRQALMLFDDSLALVPDQAEVLEMKAQVLLELEQDCLALEAAERCVQLKPCWSEAHRTLARTYVNRGELNSALKSFLFAVHLCPWEPSLREEASETHQLQLQSLALSQPNVQTGRTKSTDCVLTRQQLIV